MQDNIDYRQAAPAKPRFPAGLKVIALARAASGIHRLAFAHGNLRGQVFLDRAFLIQQKVANPVHQAKTPRAQHLFNRVFVTVQARARGQGIAALLVHRGVPVILTPWRSSQGPER